MLFAFLCGLGLLGEGGVEISEAYWRLRAWEASFDRSSIEYFVYPSSGRATHFRTLENWPGVSVKRSFSLDENQVRSPLPDFIETVEYGVYTMQSTSRDSQAIEVFGSELATEFGAHASSAKEILYAFGAAGWRGFWSDAIQPKQVRSVVRTGSGGLVLNLQIKDEGYKVPVRISLDGSGSFPTEITIRPDGPHQSTTSITRVGPDSGEDSPYLAATFHGPDRKPGLRMKVVRRTPLKNVPACPPVPRGKQVFSEALGTVRESGGATPFNETGVSFRELQGSSVETKDFGNVAPRENLRAKFLVRNQTSRILTYGGFDQACGVEAWMDGNNVLMPGEASFLHMAARSSRKRGASNTAFDLIEIDGETRNQKRFVMKWNVAGSPWVDRSELWVSPEIREETSFGIHDVPSRREVTVLNLPAGVDVRLQDASLVLKLRSPAAPGSLVGHVAVRLNSARVSANVRLPVFVKDLGNSLRIAPHSAVMMSDSTAPLELTVIGATNSTDWRPVSSSKRVAVTRVGNRVVCRVAGNPQYRGVEVVDVKILDSQANTLATSSICIVVKR